MKQYSQGRTGTKLACDDIGAIRSWFGELCKGLQNSAGIKIYLIATKVGAMNLAVV
jgi:hypothetical protein